MTAPTVLTPLPLSVCRRLLWRAQRPCVLARRGAGSHSEPPTPRLAGKQSQRAPFRKSSSIFLRLLSVTTKALGSHARPEKRNHHNICDTFRLCNAETGNPVSQTLHIYQLCKLTPLQSRRVIDFFIHSESISFHSGQLGTLMK